MSVLNPGERVFIRIHAPRDAEEGRGWEGVIVAVDAAAVRFIPEAKQAASGTSSALPDRGADKILPWHRIASIDVQRDLDGSGA